MYLFMVVIVVKEVSRCLNVKIEHTVAAHNHNILQQCIFDVHVSRSMGPQAEQK